MEQRICSQCKMSKPISEMVKDKSRRGGIRNICKPCRRLMSRKMREKYAVTDGREIGIYQEKPLANLSDEELLSYLVKFCEEYGRPPTSVDLDGLDGYPHVRTYYRRFTDCTETERTRNWNDILALAGITPLDIDKVWIAWEYLVSLACEKLYRDCLFQPANVVPQSRPDIVVESENLIIDAATSNYVARHKKEQFKKALEAGYRVEYWCLYKTTKKGIDEEELTYVFSNEIIKKLEQAGEDELAENMTKLLEQYEQYAEEIIEHRKQYIVGKLKEVYATFKRTPRMDELILVKGCPSVSQITKVFKTYNAALEYAGLPIGRKTIRLYDEEIAVQDLIKLTKKIGRVPTYKEVDTGNLTYSTKVYKKYFGGIRKCLEQQGFDIEAMLLQEKQQKLNV
ncbi:MAG: hypothetical protein ABS949_18775 [Solibacillus sp.]